MANEYFGSHQFYVDMARHQGMTERHAALLARGEVLATYLHELRDVVDACSDCAELRQLVATTENRLQETVTHLEQVYDATGRIRQEIDDRGET